MSAEDGGARLAEELREKTNELEHPLDEFSERPSGDRRGRTHTRARSEVVSAFRARCANRG